MKKYLPGSAAIILAICLSAFTLMPVKKTNGKFTDYTLYIQAYPTSSYIVTNLTNWVSRNTLCGTTQADQMACKIISVSDLYVHDTTINSTTYQTPNRLGSTPVGESEFGIITAFQFGTSGIYYVASTDRGVAVNTTLPD